jgi:hypothetical protein
MRTVRGEALKHGKRGCHGVEDVLRRAAIVERCRQSTPLTGMPSSIQSFTLCAIWSMSSSGDEGRRWSNSVFATAAIQSASWLAPRPGDQW